jgi:hypothetical protein
VKNIYAYRGNPKTRSDGFQIRRPIRLSEVGSGNDLALVEPPSATINVIFNVFPQQTELIKFGLGEEISGVFILSVCRVLSKTGGTGRSCRSPNQVFYPLAHFLIYPVTIQPIYV